MTWLVVLEAEQSEEAFTQRELLMWHIRAWEGRKATLDWAGSSSGRLVQ